MFALPSDRLGEEPAAVIYSQDGLGAEELYAFLEGRLARFKLPAKIWFSDQPLAPSRHRQDRPGDREREIPETRQPTRLIATH